ncbi:MAG: hypothetical protein OXF88_12740 [Rhodobacteraceae bacterium]|nr:hypothetical protein [Paracoccaceae bacterium]
MKHHRLLLATSALVALTPVTAPPAIALELDFGGYFTDFETLSRDRAAEMYAFALQHVAGDYLDAISADNTRTFLNLLESAGTALPEGQGTIPVANVRRLNALGLQAAAADGQLAVWVRTRDLRSGAQGIDIELAAQRLHLEMVGRIRGTTFHRDGLPPEAINPALAAMTPDAAVGVVLAIRSPADIVAEDPDATAHRRRPCPPGQHGFGIQEIRTYVRRLRGDGQAETAWAGSWQEVARSCMNEHTREVVTAEQCPAPDPGFIFYRIEQRVEKHPDDPYGFRIWREATGPSNEISRTCGITGKRLETSNHKETDTRERACADVYAPRNPPQPAWSGEVSESREIQVLRSWFVGEEADALERQYFGAWTEQSENCSRVLTRAITRQDRRTCPSTHPKGDSYRKDAGTETYREFHSGAPKQTIRVDWNDNWVVISNSCYRPWTTSGTETRTSGCRRQQRSVTKHWRELERNIGVDQLVRTSPGAWRTVATVSGCRTSNNGIGNSSGGNGGNGKNRENTGRITGVDTDGDGDIDVSLTEANNPENNIEYDKDDVVTKRDDELTPDDFRQDDNDNDDSDDGDSGGGCFLTTAVIDLRGETDKGPTLSILREFRDGWLAETEEGRALIAEYYLVSPRVVQAIPEGHPEWFWIAEQIDAAAQAIRAGLNKQALTTYAGMVRKLQDRWL